MKIFNIRNLLLFVTLALLYIVFISYNQQFIPARKVTEPPPPPRENIVNESPFDMVVLEDIIPDIEIELRYATDNNVFGESVYDTDIAYIRRGTAEKLKNAQAEFRDLGYSLKVWDAYRPPEAQFKLWEIMPDQRYVANPYTGHSFHSTGAAVDVTLIDKNGVELKMPSEFDDFTPRANRDYTGIDEEAERNSRLLEDVLIRNGFISIFYEWWHFVDNERDKYSVIDSENIPGF